MDKSNGHDGASIAVSAFKLRCLAILDQVAKTGVPIIVTKRGKPLVRVVPVEAEVDGLIGSVRVLTESDEDLYSAGGTWEA